MHRRRSYRWFALLLSLVALLSLRSLHAAIPTTLNYQGYLTDASGVALNGSHSGEFAIYAAPAGGDPPLWSASHNFNVVNGLFQVELGSDPVFPAGLFASPRYLGIAIDGDTEMQPRLKLGSVPSAFVAESLVACASGETNCDGVCIDLQQDANNCGSCGTACAGSDSCCDGNCVGGIGDLCATGQPGVCAAGSLVCSGGAAVCAPIQPPSTEVCDGLDNNCDGQIDNGNPGGGAACNTGQLGICASGTTQCSNGTLVCQQNTQPSPEVCDDLDNNCNGENDEGNPGSGAACSTGLPGVCGSGTTECNNGVLVCQQNTQPSPEICDGQDNNCSGVADEGNPGGGAACNTGQLGICASGTIHCLGGVLSCVQDQLPIQEICDGQDNDCNGVTDEGNPGGGASCNTGLPGVCASGTTQCSNGALVCQQNTQPSVEICDGLDNDCNGVIDDGNSCP